MSWIGSGDVDKEINNAKSIKDLNNWREKKNKNYQMKEKKYILI